MGLGSGVRGRFGVWVWVRVWIRVWVWVRVQVGEGAREHEGIDCRVGCEVRTTEGAHLVRGRGWGQR